MTTPATLADFTDPVRCPRLVEKIGSSLLVTKDGVRRGWIEALVA
jgi:glutamate 5-kinase